MLREFGAIILLLFIAATGTLHAQNTQMTLSDCVNYGLTYHPDVKVAQLQRQDADWQVRESKGGGLPQLTAGVSYQYFLKKPGLPAKALGFPTDPNDPNAASRRLTFVLGHSTSGNVTLSQLFFSNSYRIAVRAADFYRQYATEQEDVARKKVRDAVTMAKWKSSTRVRRYPTRTCVMGRGSGARPRIGPVAPSRAHFRPRRTGRPTRR